MTVFRGNGSWRCPIEVLTRIRSPASRKVEEGLVQLSHPDFQGRTCFVGRAVIVVSAADRPQPSNDIMKDGCMGQPWRVPEYWPDNQPLPAAARLLGLHSRMPGL